MKIMGLYERMKQQIQDITHSQYSIYLLDALFDRTLFKSSDLFKRLKKDFSVHEKTTPALLKQLREAGVLHELQVASGRRAAVLCFPQLINVVEVCSLSLTQTVLCSLNRFLCYTKCFVTILRSTKYGAGARGVTLMPALHSDLKAPHELFKTISRHS